jgi:hypothetical protein
MPDRVWYRAEWKPTLSGTGIQLTKTNLVLHKYRAERKPTLSGTGIEDGFHSALYLFRIGLVFAQLYTCAGQGMFSLSPIPV